MGRYLSGTPLERIMDKVEVVGECWVWNGAINRGGYARFNYLGESMLVHRWIYQFFNGPIEQGNEIDHICRNRKCVFHGHLRQSNRSQNMANTEKHIDNKSGFKGVDFHRGTGKWRARVGGSHLGLFPTKEEAYAAYSIAAKEKFGEFWIG